MLERFRKPKPFDFAPEQRLGCCLTPNHLSAVVISENFEIKAQLLRPVPKFLVNLTQGPDDITLLTQFIKDTLGQWTKPFASELLPVDLTLATPVNLTAYVDRQISTETVEPEVLSSIQSTQTLAEKIPFYHFASIWQTESQNAFAVCAMDKMPIRRYEKAFDKAGFEVQTIQPIFLSMARSLAASGVVDVIVNTHGKVLPWAIATLVDEQVCVQLWQGASLLYLHSFALPRTTRLLEKKLIETALISGVSYPALWFVWKEPFLSKNFKLDSLNLKAPTYPMPLGPYFQSQLQVEDAQHQAQSDTILNLAYENPVNAPFGAAMYQNLHLPLQWDFATMFSKQGVLV